jgi:hypothetical protein
MGELAQVVGELPAAGRPALKSPLKGVELVNAFQRISTRYFFSHGAWPKNLTLG